MMFSQRIWFWIVPGTDPTGQYARVVSVCFTPDHSRSISQTESDAVLGETVSHI